MPSPIGHLLAGTAIAWVAEPHTGHSLGRRPGAWNLVWLCAVTAAIADADLFFPVVHRGASHSLAAVAIVAILTAAVTRWVTGRVGWNIVLAVAAAYGSHLVLDWLSVDTFPPRGLQALWPLSDAWYISEVDLFPRIERRQPFSLPTISRNIWAGLVEVAVLVPVLVAARSIRKREPRTK